MEESDYLKITRFICEFSPVWLQAAYRESEGNLEVPISTCP